MTTACDTEDAEGGWCPVTVSALLMVLWLWAYSGFTNIPERAVLAGVLRERDGDKALEGLLGTASCRFPCCEAAGVLPPEGSARFAIL